MEPGDEIQEGEFCPIFMGLTIRNVMSGSSGTWYEQSGEYMALALEYGLSW